MHCQRPSFQFLQAVGNRVYGHGFDCGTDMFVGVGLPHYIKRAGDFFVGEFFGEIFNACDIVGSERFHAVDAEFAVYAE